MKERKTAALILIFLLNGLAMVAAQGTGAATNPLLADPTVFYHRGVYYLYGTGNRNVNQGFTAFTSSDTRSWKYEGAVLDKSHSFGTRGFWAPQVFYHKKKYYMAYTADEHIAIATARGPLGPFTQKELRSIPSQVKMIDPFVFIEGGTIYLYHVRVHDGGNKIYVSEMKDDFSGIKEQTTRLCIAAGEGWEDTQNARWKVAEGPTVFKKGNLYYMLYSANDFRNPDYAIGYAVSKTPVGPWVKYKGNPIISSRLLGINGTGHGDLFTVSGILYYVFHTHQSNEKVGPRKTALIKLALKKDDRGTPYISADTSSFHFLKTYGK